MAGGLGTRLRPLTFSIPKPLLPVGEKPILEIILSKLKKHGLTDVILSVGQKSELIKTYFGDGSKWDVEITYSREDEPLGTAGPLALIDNPDENFGPTCKSSYCHPFNVIRFAIVFPLRSQADE